MGVDWALWIGDLDDRLSVEETPTCAARADNVPGLRKHWVSESKGSVYDGDASRAVSNHLIKILAVYAMSDRPGVTGVAYVDLDAMAHREDILKLLDGDRTPLHGDHGAETFLGVMLGTTHPKGFRMPFWQTSSNRFYVKARDPCGEAPRALDGAPLRLQGPTPAVARAAPPRKFAYFGSHNISRVIAVPDSLYDPFKLPDGSLAPRGAMRNNREFVEYFGLDLIAAAARADADRGWSLASLYGPSHRGD
ncbi:tRNA (adenine-N6-)-methyltransferase [Aureococcus anophagefferens]|nr:tRNA (adenine-N6-)-methyltransferase [Aureococcus anophagefferens]